MPLSAGRLFQLEKFRRDLENCGDPERLREIGHSLLSLYLHQQQAVESLINQDWLPASATQGVQIESRRGAPPETEGDR